MGELESLKLRLVKASRAKNIFTRKIKAIFEDRTGFKWGQRVSHTNQLGEKYIGTVTYTEFDEHSQFNATVLFDYAGTKQRPLGLVKFYKVNEGDDLCLLNQS